MSNRRKIQDSKESRYAWVKYSLGKASTEKLDGKAPRGEDLIRNFSAIDPYSKEFDWKNTADQVLLQNVKSISFEFFDREKEKWVERLRETGVDKEIPRIIRVNLVWVNELGNDVEFSRTFRSLWPYFDTVADEKERQEALKGEDEGGLGGSTEENDDE